MATIIIPPGFTQLEECYTGQNGTIRGQVPMKVGIADFFYTHDILRTFGINNTFDQVTVTGNTSIQIVENNNPGAKVLFDQTVQFSINLIAVGDPLFGSIGV